MPELDIRKTKTIELPSYPESKIEIYDRLNVGDFVDAQKIQSDDERGIFLTIRLIKDWNFETDGKKSPITAESLKKLEMKDFTILVNKMNEIVGTAVGDKKKMN